MRRHPKQLIHRIIIKRWVRAKRDKKVYCLGARARMADDKPGKEWQRHGTCEVRDKDQHPLTVERRLGKTCGDDILDGCVVERGI